KKKKKKERKFIMKKNIVSVLILVVIIFKNLSATALDDKVIRGIFPVLRLFARIDGGNSPDLIRRQSCPDPSYVLCPDDSGCCPMGSTCLPDNQCNVSCGINDIPCGSGCCPPGQICGGNFCYV